MDEKTTKTYDVAAACAAQAKYLKDTKTPDFPPKDGRCWRCGKNIYQQIDRGTYKSGISVEEAASRLVTGCPHCHRSYVD